MERDASTPPTTPAEALPPYEPTSVRLIALVGLGLNAVAGVLSIVAAMSTPPPAILTTVQVLLIFIGTVTAGSALSMRPDLWWSWGLWTIAALLGAVGLPASWDSFPVLFYVFAGIGVVGAIACVSSPGLRVAIASAAIMFHFSGIFAATTSPPPQPWLVEQMWSRVYHPYLNFVYLRNAYHFYSPDPGPASILVFLIKTETGTDASGKKQYTTRWVVMPKRPADLKDPLGLAYYRRLSLTEQVARPGQNTLDQFERSEMWMRRYSKSSVIPFHPIDNATAQYRLPGSEIIRYVLPSYSSHIILEETPNKEVAAKTTVKIYRLEHQTTTVDRFRQGDSPYHPATYRPFYLGEFDVRGNQVDPQDELLYWMIPVIPRPVLPGDPNQKSYIDYMSVHALGLSRDEVLAAPEGAENSQVFDWSQFRPARERERK